MRWLRYYLDFCLKYKFNQSDKESLSHFMNKLQEKNQTDQQQEQASDAAATYHETGATQSGESLTFDNKNPIISTKKRVYNQKIQIGNRSAMILMLLRSWSDN